MRDLEQLQSLRPLVQTQYTIAQQGFQKIVAEENALRIELQRLAEMETAARADVHEAMHLQAIGADIVWAAWVGRTRTTLNMALARVLAQKEPHLKAVKKAYGKLLVVDELLAKETREVQQKRQAIALNAIIAEALRAQVQ